MHFIEALQSLKFKKSRKCAKISYNLKGGALAS